MPDKVVKCDGCKEDVKIRHYKGIKRPFGCKCPGGSRGSTEYHRHQASTRHTECDECGSCVFFYRNTSNGGCAWFDELGPPWPLHECKHPPEDKWEDLNNPPPGSRHVGDSQFWLKSFLIPKIKTSNCIIIGMDKKPIPLEMELTEGKSARLKITKVQDQLFTIVYESELNCILAAPFGESNLTFKAKIYPTQGSLFED